MIDHSAGATGPSRDAVAPIPCHLDLKPPPAAPGIEEVADLLGEAARLVAGMPWDEAERHRRGLRVDVLDYEVNVSRGRISIGLDRGDPLLPADHSADDLLGSWARSAGTAVRTTSATGVAMESALRRAARITAAAYTIAEVPFSHVTAYSGPSRATAGRARVFGADGYRSVPRELTALLDEVAPPHRVLLRWHLPEKVRLVSHVSGEAVDAGDLSIVDLMRLAPEISPEVVAAIRRDC